MTSKSTIGEVTVWLEGLQRAAQDVRRAGLAAGANQATRDGFRAAYGRDGLLVAFRGRARMDNVEPAIVQGMTDEFVRRAR